MMTLNDIARSQDTELFQDTYTGEEFYGQMLLFTDSTRSGPSSKRRILEIGPDVPIPEKFTVTDVASGQVFIMSSVSFDWWKGKVISKKLPVLPVDAQFLVRSLEQILLGAGGYSDIYMEPSYIRRVILEDQSDYLGGYEIRYSNFFSIPAGTVLFGKGRWYRAREHSRVDDIGFGTVEAVELDAPLSTQLFTPNKGKLDPVTDTISGAVPVTVATFTEPLVLDYRHEVLGYIKPEAGDLAVSVLKSQVPVIARGDKFGSHNVVMAAESNGNCWTAHVRRNQ